MSDLEKSPRLEQYLGVVAEYLSNVADDGQDMEPLVRTSRGPDPVSFSGWADLTSRGLLTAPGDSGKTFVLNRYTLARVHRSQADPGLLIPLRMCLGRLQADFDDTLAPLAAAGGADQLGKETVESWAKHGAFLFLIDGIEDLPEERQAAAVDWIARCRYRYPANRMVVAARSGTLPTAGWDRVELTAEIRPVRPAPDCELPARNTEWRAVSALIRTLDTSLEPSAAVRWDAAVSLERLDERAIDAMLRSVDPQFEESSRVRKFAAKALGRIGSDRVVDDIVRFLASPDEEANDVREGLAEALGRLATPAAVEALIHHVSAANEDDERVRSAAARALELALVARAS